MQPRSAAGTAALNVAVSIVVLVVGLVGGAAFGLLKGSSAAAAVPEATNHIAGFTPVEQFSVAGLTVEEAPAPAPVRRTVRRVVTQSAPARSTAAGGAAAVLVPSVPGAVDAVSGIGSPNCARLDDAKINWLLGLVAKARSSNPDQAAVADNVERQLLGAMGKNMCAERAQIYVGNMCQDPAIARFMGLMVKELPFFVRPLVGDPCKQDLVAAADKYL